MGILDEVSSATGDKSSNGKLVDRCLETPGLLHTVAEGLRTGTPSVRTDCVAVLASVANLRPELLANFVSDLLDASRSKRKAIAKHALVALAQVTPHSPVELYAQRDYLLEVARGGGTSGLAAAGVLAQLCGKSPNYRGKLLGHTLRLLQQVADKELPKWATTLAPATAGSTDAVKRLKAVLQPRRGPLPEAANKKLDKLIAKLERAPKK